MMAAILQMCKVGAETALMGPVQGSVSGYVIYSSEKISRVLNQDLEPTSFRLEILGAWEREHVVLWPYTLSLLCNNAFVTGGGPVWPQVLRGGDMCLAQPKAKTDWFQ